MPIFHGRKPFVTSRLTPPTLSFSNLANTSITVSWTSEVNATNYLVQRSTAVDFSQNLTTVFQGIGLTFTDTGLSQNTQYFYRVRAKGIGFIDSNFGVDTATTLGGGSQLNTPTVTRLGIGTTSATITWPSVSSAAAYVVQRATDAGFTANLTTLYNGNPTGVTRQFTPGYMLEYNDAGLTAGTTYFYRVKATASGFVDSSYGTRSITTAASNRTINQNAGTLVANGLDPTVWSEGGLPVAAGDTVAVTNPVSGNWQYFVLQNIYGTPTQPITIRNNGQILMTNGFSFETCSYINLTGDHSSKTQTEGFDIEGIGSGAGFEVFGLCHHMGIDRAKVTGCAYGIRVKNENNTYATLPDCGAFYWWPSRMTDINIGRLNLLNLSQDMMYIGSSGPWANMRFFTCNGNLIGPRPTGLANIEIHDCIFDRAGRSAMQLGSMDTGTNRIHHNTVSETGFEYDVAQGAGIAVGGAVGSIEIDHNSFTRTFREGVYSYNFGQMYLHDNTFTNIGTISVDSKRTIFWTKINLTGGQTVSSTWMDGAPGFGGSGKVIRDNLNEYFFEFFLNQGGNPLIKTQRITDNESGTLLTIPTTHPTTVNLTVGTGFTYTNGQAMLIANDQNNFFRGTITSYNSGSGALVISSTSNGGSGTFRKWGVYRETRTPEAAIAAIGQVAIGAHAGTQADPYAGFGANSPITSGQVIYPTEITIPSGVGNFMMNCFSADPVNVYGTPAGLTTFRIENNAFGSQTAASTKVITFLNSQNLYGTGNVICGNTYLGSPIVEANITKPSGSVVTYTLSDTCGAPSAFTNVITGQDNGDNTLTLKWTENASSLSATKFRLVGLGSSTLVGTGATSPNNLPGYIQAALTANTAGGTLINMAVGGFDTRNFMTEGDNINVKVYQNVDAAIAHHPHAVFISLPTNDIGAGLTPGQFVNNLLAIYNLLKSYGIPCFVETTQPRDSFNGTQQADLATAAALIRTSFPSKFVVDVFDLVRDTGNVNPAVINPIYAAGDAIHLNSAGQQIIFNQLQAKMSAYFADSTYTEYEISRSTSPTSGFTIFDTVVGGTTIQKNYNRVDGSLYYYRVRGKKTDNSYSDYSNVVSVQQPISVGALQQTVKVNFGNEVDPAATTDWNTLVGSTTAQMAAGTVFSNLTDSAVAATGINLTITKKFDAAVGNGSNIAGVFPAAVARHSWPARGGFNDYSQLKFSGLQTNATYSLEVLTSFATSGPVEMAVRARSQAYKQNFEFSNNYPTGSVANNTNLITLKGLIADSNGEMMFDFLPSVNSGGYVCGMLLKRFAGNTIIGTTLPAKIEAETFSAMSGVSTQSTTDTGGGLNITGFDPADWLEYLVNHPTGDYFTLKFRQANTTTNVQMQVSVDGVIKQTVDMTSTGGTQTWVTWNSGPLYIPAGNHTIRITCVGAAMNLNWIDFALSSAEQTIGGQYVDQYRTGQFYTNSYALTYVPSTYLTAGAINTTYPLIIFLHGAGQTGDNIAGLNNLLQESLPKRLSEGLQPSASDGTNTREFIVISPQAPSASAWSLSAGHIQYLLPTALKKYRIDASRVYITGLSAGGTGSISVAGVPSVANAVSAIVPIAAAGFNSTADDNAWPSTGGTYNVKLLDIVGGGDAWKTFNDNCVARYNSATPAPTVVAKQTVIAGAGHDAGTWYTCFGLAFDINNGVGSPMNVYAWMLQYSKPLP